MYVVENSVNHVMFGLYNMRMEKVVYTEYIGMRWWTVFGDLVMSLV